VTVAQAVDHELSATDGAQEALIVSGEKVQSAIPAPLMGVRVRQVVEPAGPIGGVLELGQEVEITGVGRPHHRHQFGQRIDVFAKRGLLADGVTGPLYHRTVVPEVGDIIGHRLHPQDAVMLVIHLDGDRPEGMFDTGALRSGDEQGVHGALGQMGKLAAEECRHPLRLRRQDHRARQVLIDLAQRGRIAKHDVRGILHLGNGPVIRGLERLHHRAAAPGILIEPGMQPGDRPVVRQPLRRGIVGHLMEGVVLQRKRHARRRQPVGQPGVAVEADLQPVRAPGRYAQVQQAQFRIQEIEIIVQALAAPHRQIGRPTRAAVPHLVRLAAFLGRQNADQARRVASGRAAGLRHLFLAHAGLPDELDRLPVRRGQRLRGLFDPVSQPHHQRQILRQRPLPAVQVGRHPVPVADRRQRAEEQNPVVTRQHAGNLVRIARLQVAHGSPSERKEYSDYRRCGPHGKSCPQENTFPAERREADDQPSRYR